MLAASVVPQSRCYPNNLPEETETDLGEQAVLMWWHYQFNLYVLKPYVKFYYQPEIVTLNAFHEQTDCWPIWSNTYTRNSISDTAEWWRLKTGKRIVTPETKRLWNKYLPKFKMVLANKWLLENRAAGRAHSYWSAYPCWASYWEGVGAKLRGMMSWLKDKK